MSLHSSARDRSDPPQDVDTETEVTKLLPNKCSLDGKIPESRPRPRGYVPVELVSFLYFFNIFLAMPHTQFYVYGKMSAKYGLGNKTASPPCIGINATSDVTELKVQTETSTVIMYLYFTVTFIAVLPTIFLGALSDKYGRKIACLLPITGTTVRQAIYVVIFNMDADVNYLYIGNALEGACGYSGGMLVSLFSSVADITEPGKDRAFRITTVEAALFGALAVSTGVSGIWIQETGFVTPLYAMLGISVISMGIAVFILPETRQHSLTPVSVLEALKGLQRSIMFYVKDTRDKRRWKLQVAAFGFCISFSTGAALGNILTLFLLKSPFCWSMVHITVYTAAKILMDWSCILLTTRCLGHIISDINMAIIGFVSSLLGLLMTGLADNHVMIYIAAAVGIFMNAVPPMLRSVMSRLVSSEEQGVLFGSISVVEMFSGAVLGLAVTAGYRDSVGYLPGLVFLCMAGVDACIVIALLFLSCSLKKQMPRTRTISVEK